MQNRRSAQHGATSLEQCVAVALLAVVGLAGLGALGQPFDAALARGANGNAVSTAVAAPASTAPQGEPSAQPNTLSAQAGALSVVDDLAASLRGLEGVSDAAGQAARIHTDFIRAFREAVPAPNLTASLRALGGDDTKRLASIARDGLIGKEAPGHAVLSLANELPEGLGADLRRPYAPFAGTGHEGSFVDALLQGLGTTSRIVAPEHGVDVISGPLRRADASAVVDLIDWHARVLSEAFGRPLRRKHSIHEMNPTVTAMIGRTRRAWHVDGAALISVTTLTGAGTDFVPNSVLEAGYRGLRRSGMEMYVDEGLIRFLNENAVGLNRGETLFLTGAQAKQFPELFGGRAPGPLVHTASESGEVRTVAVGIYEPVP